MKLKFMKKMIAMLCAVVMSTSCVFSSVGAVDYTTNAEIEYSLMYLNRLPNYGDMENYLDMSDYSKLDIKRSEDIEHEDGTIEIIDINEKKVYDEIYNTVMSLIDKVDKNTTSKNANKSRDWRIAKAIYRWVTEKIKCDQERQLKDANGNRSFRSPQDALFVFATGKGLSVGYVDLIKVMMRIAKIPCVCLATLENIDGEGHAYNAVCLDNPGSAEEKNAKPKVWVLLDAMNEFGGNDYVKTEKQKQQIKERFPAFYRNDLSIIDANRSMIARRDHKINLIVDKSYGSKGKSVKWFNYGGIVYCLCGSEEDAYIKIVGSYRRNEIFENVQIPDDMLRLGLKFKVGNNIESIILKGNERLDVSNATALSIVDAKQSNNYETYDARYYIADSKLFYKKEYIDKLREKLESRKDEYNEIYNEYRQVTNLRGIELDSPQDGTTESRKEAWDFVNDIFNNLDKQTGENLEKANDLLNKANKRMKNFISKTTLDEKRKSFNIKTDEHRVFRNSLNGNFVDFTSQYRQNAINFYNAIINNNLNEANIKKAIDMFDEAIKQMDQFKNGTLRTLLDYRLKVFNNKIGNEFRPMFEDYCKFIKSVETNLNSPQGITAEAVKMADNLVNDINTELNVIKNSDLSIVNMQEYIGKLDNAIKIVDKAIDQMKNFKREKEEDKGNKSKEQMKESKQGGKDEKSTELLNKKRNKKRDKVAKEKAKVKKKK